MAQGLCQIRAGRDADAERSLSGSYELDAGNPAICSSCMTSEHTDR